MFEKDLQEKFEKIFQAKKVTYAMPDDVSKEQEFLFIDIQGARESVKDGVVKMYIRGTGTMFARNDALTFGTFARKIAIADPALKKNLFFFDMDKNSKTFQNVVQREFSFTYFFTGQNNPALGKITQVDMEIET